MRNLELKGTFTCDELKLLLNPHRNRGWWAGTKPRLNLIILYRPGPADNVHSHFMCAHMLQNQCFASGFCSPWGWHLLEPLTWARVYCRNKRQIMAQELREKSLWRLLLSNEMGGEKIEKVLIPKQSWENEKFHREGTRQLWAMTDIRRWKEERETAAKKKRNRHKMICKRTRNHQK